MTNKIESQINLYIKKASLGKKVYYENLQTALEIFLGNYALEEGLSFNSTPLFNILKASGKDIVIVKEYVKACTNIEKLSLSDKGGLLITYKGEFTIDNDFIDSHKWYDEAIKKDKQALKMLDDKALLNRLNSLLKAINDSTTLTLDKESIVKTLSPLQAKLKTVVDFNKLDKA